MAETAHKVRVENVSKIFGPDPEAGLARVNQGGGKDGIFQETGNVVAIADVSFAVKPGETFVVMGLSGSGKSTLIRCINRLIEPTAGHIYIDDEDLVAATPEQLRGVRLKKMSMVFQHFALFPHKTVAENVEYGLKVQGVGEAERRERAMDALQQVGLEAWADKPPANLSGGMQQRVGLARGLAVDPEILLMDEPFSALDPLIRRNMQDELLELQRKVRKTIIFITHDLHEALILGDRIAIMKEGRFVQVGKPQEIVANPADDYVAAFTQDVDRSRVFNAEWVMDATRPLAQSRDTVATALARLDEIGGDFVHVVDDDGKPTGLIARGDIAGQTHDKAVTAVMRRAFPQTHGHAELIETFGLCARGVPVAVCGDDGRLLGALDPLDVFAMLGGGERREAGGGAAAEAAATGAAAQQG